MIPTLPDPYAANFDFERRQDVDTGWASATVTWAAPPTPVLGFSVLLLGHRRKILRAIGELSSAAPVYGWFTEGFGTRDLKEAKALLDELSS